MVPKYFLVLLEQMNGDLNIIKPHLELYMLFVCVGVAKSVSLN